MKSCHSKLFLVYIICILCMLEESIALKLVSVVKFGATADARKVGDVWLCSDNSDAINKCASYCRARGLTMFFPKGNYGVASTIWLTNPDADGLRQASLTVVGSNLGAYRGQSTSSNICVLKDFKPGRIVDIRKKDKSVKEPYLVPVVAISNGRQVHIKGIGIQGGRMSDYISGVAIGNISVLVSLENVSICHIFAGLVFPGIKSSPETHAREGDNALIVVEQSTFDNYYNIVCAGTQSFACEYRSNKLACVRSIFTGTLITNEYRQTRGSHKFSSNLFGTLKATPEESVVYFDLSVNEITIDNCHFESGWLRKVPEVIVRSAATGRPTKRIERLNFTNNMVNLSNHYDMPTRENPLIDIFSGNRAIFQGNSFNVAMPLRIKAKGALFIGNSIRLRGQDNFKVSFERHTLSGKTGNITGGWYGLNHFARKNSAIKLTLPSGTVLKENVEYSFDYDKNAFNILPRGKETIAKAQVSFVMAEYQANNSGRMQFEAWGANTFNPPYGWKSRNLSLIGNKIIGKDDKGNYFEKELKQLYK